MFDSSRTSRLTRRARAALSLARSFLLLEDDYDVDWEVDQDEQSQGEPAWARAHRGELRERNAAPGLARRTGRLARRAGQATPRPQPCLWACPGRVYRETACVPDRRGSRITTGNSRLAIDL